MKKEKKKLNPLIMDQKRIKSLSTGSDDENIIKKFIIIVVVIAFVIAGLYVITEITKKKDRNSDITAGEIDYNVVSIGTLLNRPEKEYYVLIYDKKDDDAVLYSALIASYNNKNDKKIYFCDLDNKLNKKYYNVGNDNKSNPNATNIKELDLGNLTLIKVKNGKLAEYIENYEEIKNVLK